MTENNKDKQWVFITLAAAAMLMVMMGARQSLGLFVSPLNISTGLGIVTISLAMAVNQFVWGAVQPVAGALADRVARRGRGQEARLLSRTVRPSDMAQARARRAGPGVFRNRRAVGSCFLYA